MNELEQVLRWIQDNPWTTFAIIVYVVANVAPRPDHNKLDGWRKVMWQIIDRLCLLTSHRVPGSLKFLLLDSPLHVSEKEKVEKAPKIQEENGDDKDEPAVVVVDAGEEMPDGAEEEEDKDG